MKFSDPTALGEGIWEVLESYQWNPWVPKVRNLATLNYKVLLGFYLYGNDIEGLRLSAWPHLWRRPPGVARSDSRRVFRQSRTPSAASSCPSFPFAVSASGLLTCSGTSSFSRVAKCYFTHPLYFYIGIMECSWFALCNCTKTSILKL